jgi:hypothetical protein
VRASSASSSARDGRSASSAASASGLGLHADRVGLRARFFDDRGRQLLGVVQVLRDLGSARCSISATSSSAMRSIERIRSLMPWNALLRAHERAHLGAQPLGARPRVRRARG